MGILVVDCPALCYRAWHKMGGLAYEGQNTGIMYGFLTQLYTLMRPFGRSWSPAFCWDSRKSLRKEIFPDYKRKRHEELSDKDKELRQIAYRQFDLVRRKVLPALGFANNFIEIGYESDDLMAQIVQWWDAPQYAVVTSDEDMYQILDGDRVWIVKPSTGVGFTEDNFREEYNISPRDWWMVKAIGGCTTDEVPGVPGVAEKTAAKYISGELSKGKKFESILDMPGKLFERNARLVRLPFENCPRPVRQVSTFDPDGFLMICDEYGFRSLEPKVDQWSRLFGGQHGR